MSPWQGKNLTVSEDKTGAEPNPRILAEISALADGTLEPRRAAELRELIDASPELAARYQRERRAVVALQSLSADRAPASLRLAIEARRQEHPRRRRARLPLAAGFARVRGLYGGALAAGAAAAAVVALLVLLLPGGAPGAPTVSEAAALALRGPALTAPPNDPLHRGRLRADVQDVYFPDWSWGFGLRAIGQRVDRLGGKLAVTVFYGHNSSEVAYTILDTPPLRWPGSRMLHLDGIELQSFTTHGRLVVTWRRAGHTCVLSASGMTIPELAKLAGWHAPGLKA
jgi:hypothetical protein